MLALCLLSVLSLFPQDDSFVEGRLFVKLRAGASARFADHPAIIAERLALPAPRRKDTVGIARIYTLSVESGHELELAATLAAAAWVEWVDRPRVSYALFDTPPNDPEFNLQWGLDQPSDIDIDMQLAWSLRGTCEVDSDIVIGIIDTGTFVDTALPDLVGLSVVKAIEVINGLDDDANGFIDDVSGYDFVDDDGDVSTGHPHGTMVASVIAARTGNAVGMAGIASGAKVLHTRAFTDAGFFPARGSYPGQASVAASLVYLVDEGVDLINNSWGASPSPIVDDAVDYCIANGVHQFFATGNSDVDGGYPANHPDVVAVSGIQSDASKSSFANFADWVDVSAPATDILVTHYDGSMPLASGTSFSCPAAAAVAAHILSEDSDLSISDLRTILVEGGQEIDSFNPSYVGKLGTLLNAFNSLALMEPFAELTPSPLPVTGTFEPVLNAWGGVKAQDKITFSLSSAAPVAQAVVVLGLSQVNVKAVGGILVPAPDVLKFFNTDQTGARALSLVLPSDLGAGVEVWAQMLSRDQAAPSGWSFSNVVQVTGE